ncbi:MAG TPA: glycosyltransferase family 8 protein [Candidatus Gemmiger stercorigallinarum]|nr:glycosyltransferase family 8 protein [Candidatus Gemmiger stercorigallinarum]
MLSVLYGCDDNYAPHAGISMTSLLENNRDIDELTVYFAAQDLSQQNLDRLCALARQYGRRIVFLDTCRARQAMDQYPCRGWNGSLATWLRFFVLDQIPVDVDRLLWLDADTIVTGSLKPLCSLSLDGWAAACACDAICYRERYRLGFSSQDAYYNAGVILFHLAYWRQQSLLDSLFRRLPERIDSYRLNDQDMLNDMLFGRIQKLPPAYNLQGTHLAYDTQAYFSVYPWQPSAYYTPAQIDAARAAPVVVHFFRFLGDYPWQAGDNLHPARTLYQSWKEKSLWADVPAAPARREAVFAVEKLLYRLLPQTAFLRLFSAVTNRGLPAAPAANQIRQEDLP